MKTIFKKIFLLTGILFFGFILVLIANKVYLTPPSFSVENNFYLGYSEFYNSLKGAGYIVKIEPANFNNIAYFGRGVLWIIFSPTENYSLKEKEEIKKFVSRGGIVLFASRKPSAVAEDFGIKVLDSPLVDYNSYHKRQDLPILPASVDGKTFYYLVYKFPSVIKEFPSQAKIISKSSSVSFVDVDNNGKITTKDLHGPFPVIVKVSQQKGFFILSTDPAIFSNDLIGRKDNLKFALKLISSLNPQLIIFDESHSGFSNLSNAAEFLILISKFVKDQGVFVLITLLGIFFFGMRKFLNSREKKKKFPEIEKRPTEYSTLAKRILAKYGDNFYTRQWIVLMNYREFRRKISLKLGIDEKKEFNKKVVFSHLNLSGEEKNILESLIDLGEKLEKGDKLNISSRQMLEIIKHLKKIEKNL